MITLNEKTSKLIKDEMESIPLKYQKPFNSLHEGIGVLREEYMELEQEIFFGEKKAGESKDMWKDRVRNEAVQVAAMACRIIQELT